MKKVIVATLILIALAIVETGCTSGGYVQIGYIPVTEVKDVHTTIKPKRNLVSNASRVVQANPIDED